MLPVILYVKVSRNSVMNDCVSGYSPLQLKSNSYNKNNHTHKKIMLDGDLNKEYKR